MLPLLAILAVAAPAAPPPAQPADTTITVTNQRLTDAEISRQARNYVGSVMPPNPSYDQYARWTVPVCPKVTGIADPYAAIVETRIRNAAAAARITVARPGCKTNLSIVFSADSRVTAAVIVRRKPKQIDRLNGTETDTLLKAPLPVRWWHVLAPGGTITSSGDTAALGPGQAGGGSGTIGGSAGTSAAITTNSYSSSLIDTHLAVGATSAVAIVDIPLVTGKPLVAVADYLAMVTLAPARLPPATPASASILALFSAGDAAPAALTGWDKAFLAALYRMAMNRTARWQQNQIVTGIATDIKAAPVP